MRNYANHTAVIDVCLANHLCIELICIKFAAPRWTRWSATCLNFSPCHWSPNRACRPLDSTANQLGSPFQMYWSHCKQELDHKITMCKNYNSNVKKKSKSLKKLSWMKMKTCVCIISKFVSLKTVHAKHILIRFWRWRKMIKRKSGLLEQAFIKQRRLIISFVSN